ncbi:hypothetical protein INT48_004155 [Thamnidium elegans]|uniref:Myb-like domain-containing protein n=1 Tax=Thamnidium elegans TaxID=101142 RepID=A0A8H7SUS1_9FUNG|nr:hypothetical protein INT48_004155 [Thamnidium elegans]
MSEADTVMEDTQMEENITPEELVIKKKQEWIKQFRLKFCVREEFEITKNMIYLDGSLNQDYFRPPKGLKKEEARKWTDVERGLLIQGIEKYGIGHFGEMSKEYLPKWSTNDLRVKSIRLIGRQNLQMYRGWKGNEQDIAREYEANKEIGLNLSVEPDLDSKRPRNNTLLTDLTDILAEIKSTPSSGEISAELLNSLRLLMLQIENLSTDESNTEAKFMKDESDKCLDVWFQDLVAQCEADGEELLEEQLFNAESDNEDEEEELALALALQDEEDYCQEVEVCSKQLEDDDEEDIEVEIV